MESQWLRSVCGIIIPLPKWKVWTDIKVELDATKSAKLKDGFDNQLEAAIRELLK